MPGHLPPRPGGSARGAVFQQWVHDKLAKESRVNEVASGLAVSNTTRGKVIVPTGGSKRGGGTSVEMFVLMSVEDDYLVCREWDGVAAGSDDVLVAKQYKHRCSVSGERVMGFDWIYAHYDDPDDTSGNNVIRRATKLGPNSTEEWRIVPPWVTSWTDDAIPEAPVFHPGEIIYAIEAETGVTGTDGGDIEYLDCCSSRIWARIR
jgi:hypothetical protein